MHRSVLLLLATLMACENSGYADITGPPTGTQPTQPAGADRLAVDLELIGVAVYQGTEVTLYDGGDDLPELQAPLIRNRDAFVRVFVKPNGVFESRRIRAVLEVETADGSIETLEERIRVKDRSTKGDLDSTFNFDLTADQVKPSTRFTVHLYELDNADLMAGEALTTEWESGKIDWEKSDTVTVHIIPVNYQPGGNLLPDYSQSQLDGFERLMKSMYPVEDIQITVGDILDWDRTIDPNGNGWDDLLNRISGMRSNASVDSNTYYYGLFITEPNFTSFCSRGCVLGLSNLAYNAYGDPYYRSSIGLGYTGFGQVAATTLVHEVGHAHGRSHADCGGARGIDPNYPYEPEAIIGSWGYDTATGVLYAPQQNHDMMAYCDPMWISDYQYYSLYQRIIQVGQVSRQARVPWQMVMVGQDGEAKFGGIERFTPGTPGDPVEVELIDAIGRVVEVVDGRFVPYSHIDGGIVLIPTVDNERVIDVRVPTLDQD